MPPKRGRAAGKTAFADHAQLADILNEELKGPVVFKPLNSQNPRAALLPNKSMCKRIQILAPGFWIASKTWGEALGLVLDKNAVVEAGLRNESEKADWLSTTAARGKEHCKTLALAHRRKSPPKWFVEVFVEAEGAAAATAAPAETAAATAAATEETPAPADGVGGQESLEEAAEAEDGAEEGGAEESGEEETPEKDEEVEPEPGDGVDGADEIEISSTEAPPVASKQDATKAQPPKSEVKALGGMRSPIDWISHRSSIDHFSMCAVIACRLR